MEIDDVLNYLRPPSCLLKSPQKGVLEKNRGSLSHFRYLRMQKLRKGSITPPKTTSAEEKGFILEFQVQVKFAQRMTGIFGMPPAVF